MKLRQLITSMALLVLPFGSAFGQIATTADIQKQVAKSPYASAAKIKQQEVYPGGVHYMTLKHDGLPATATKEVREAYKAQKKVQSGAYPFPVQMYDYLDYCWLPDTISDPYTEDDEVVWSLPKFSYYNYHKPDYGMGCGAFIEDGKLHTFVSDFTYAFVGVYRFDMVTYNAENMQVISHKNFDSSDLNNLCLAQCQYPLDEKKGIGIFYNTTTKGEDWVLIDYENQSLERLGKADKNFGILVTDGTYLYGWCEDNCIYKIDPTTFEITKVGAHGFAQYIDQGDGTMGAYVQSATYDKNTKTCYWGAFSAKTGESGFFKVNLQTAKIEKVLNTYIAQHLGICTSPQECGDSVPGPVTDLALQFEGTSRKGTATFTMPTLNYKGDQTLDEPLSYRLTQGTTTLAEADSVKPGEKVTLAISLRKDGNYNFVVQTKNALGWSPKANKHLYVGYDTPEAPDSAQLTISKDGVATLTWHAPTKGTHNGALADMIYDIYRIQGKKMTLVSIGQSELTFTEQLPIGAITSYQYAIIADNQGHQSDFCYSNAAACGKAYDCPVVVDFTDNDVFNTFTVKDANEDGYTWSWDNDRDYLGYAMYRYNTQLDGDDWLFSPSINLQAGHTYKLTYTAHCLTMSLPERLSIALGKNNTPDAMTQMLVTRRDLPATKRAAELTFTVAEDGEYYLGFYACSDKNELDLMLNGFRVDEVPLNGIPAAVENFSCTPGDKGSDYATIKFTAPTKTVGGDALTSISKITIERDLNVVQTWENVEPGKSLEFTDVVGTDGYHDWVVRTYNVDVPGAYVEKKLYLGYDEPANVVNAYVKDNKTSLEICWDPVTVGAHGGYIDPAGVTYEVRDWHHQVMGTTKDNSLTISCEDTDEQDLDVVLYRIYSINDKGYVPYAQTEYFILGPIYQLPFVDSAPDGQAQNGWWQYYGDEQTSYTMGIGTGASSDGDNGCFGWHCYTAGDNFHFRTIKLDFTKAQNPMLNFSIAVFVPNFNIKVNAITPSHEVINVADIDIPAESAGYWGDISMDLPKELANDRYAVIEFHITGQKDDSWLYMDNVNIYDKDVDGIEEIENTTSIIPGGNMYDLMGRRLSSPRHGQIVIHDGKKMLVK